MLLFFSGARAYTDENLDDFCPRAAEKQKVVWVARVATNRQPLAGFGLSEVKWAWRSRVSAPAHVLGGEPDRGGGR